MIDRIRTETFEAVFVSYDMGNLEEQGVVSLKAY